MTQHAYRLLHNKKVKRAIIQEEECKIATEAEVQEYINNLKREQDKVAIIEQMY